MSKSLNRVQFIGHVGKDPEVVNSNSGTKISKFVLAVNDSFKSKTGEWQERTEWINAVSFGKLADVVESYVKKGSQLYIEGKLQTRSYEKDGTTKYFTEVLVNELILLSKSKDDPAGEEVPAKPKTTRARPVTTADPINSDDIPF